MSHPFLPAVIDLVRQAGALTLPFWRCETEVTAKLDDSPVTAADLAALVRARLQQSGLCHLYSYEASCCL